MDWHALQKKKVTELREMAKEHAGIKGTTGLTKDQLVEALAQALGIDKPHLVAESSDKTKIKQKIRTLRGDIRTALHARDHALAKRKRRQIHRLKRRIRRSAHLTH